MLVLENENLNKFRKMFSYIPKKIFPSILFCIEKNENKVKIKFSDLDINQSLVVNISTELEDIDYDSIEEMSFRIPLTKSIDTVVSGFDTLIFNNNTLKGLAEKKEVELSLFINDSDIYEFPDTSSEMLEFTKSANDRDDAMYSEFELTTQHIKDIYSCLKVVDSDKDDILLNFTMGKKANSIAVQSKDTIGNNFKYVIDEVKSISDTFKAKYDRYLLSVFDVLKNSEINTFDCIISNLMFGTDFKDYDVNVMLAVTIFEKI